MKDSAHALFGQGTAKTRSRRRRILWDSRPSPISKVAKRHLHCQFVRKQKSRAHSDRNYFIRNEYFVIASDAFSVDYAHRLKSKLTGSMKSEIALCEDDSYTRVGKTSTRR